MTVLATLQHRLRGHTCYEGCEDLLCLAAREIERLRENLGLAEAAMVLARAHPECWQDVLDAYGENRVADLDARKETR